MTNKKSKQQSISIIEPNRTIFMKKYPHMLTTFVNKAIKASLNDETIFLKIITTNTEE